PSIFGSIDRWLSPGSGLAGTRNSQAGQIASGLPLIANLRARPPVRSTQECHRYLHDLGSQSGPRWKPSWQVATCARAGRSHEIALKEVRNVSELVLNWAMAANYIIGPFRLDTQAGILFRGAEPVALGQRAVALLRVFVERPGIPVSKDALIEAAWADLS